MKSRYLIISLTLLVWLSGLVLPVQGKPVMQGQILVDALRGGGYNLYFRHEATDWTQQDHVNQRNDWLSCNGTEIRQLSDRGRFRAERTGKAMRRLEIPVSEVVASPYCRTVESARLLGLGKVRASDDVINMRVASYFGGAEAVIATARRLLARPPEVGSNRVIVAHGNVAQAATPVYPGEGEAVVFEPDGRGGFVYVGRIPPHLWAEFDRPE